MAIHNFTIKSAGNIAKIAELPLEISTEVHVFQKSAYRRSLGLYKREKSLYNKRG
jgi:hypothetical protein